MPYLIFCHLQKRASWRVAVERDPFTIGGSLEATVTVADPMLAGEEIVIRRQGEGYQFESLAAHRKVLLNGTPVVAAEISTGDRLRLGSTFMLFIAETHPSDARIDELESILDREIFAPAAVKEALEADRATHRWNWPVLVAFAVCGLAVGVLLAIIVARLRE